MQTTNWQRAHTQSLERPDTQAQVTRPTTAPVNLAATAGPLANPIFSNLEMTIFSIQQMPNYAIRFLTDG